MPIKVANRKVQYKYFVVMNGKFMYEELVEFRSRISTSIINRWFFIPQMYQKENGKIFVVIRID